MLRCHVCPYHLLLIIYSCKALLFMFASLSYRYRTNVTALIQTSVLLWLWQNRYLIRVEGSFHQPNWLQVTFDRVANQSSSQFSSGQTLSKQTDLRWLRGDHIRRKNQERSLPRCLMRRTNIPILVNRFVSLQYIFQYDCRRLP